MRYDYTCGDDHGTIDRAYDCDAWRWAIVAAETKGDPCTISRPASEISGHPTGELDEDCDPIYTPDLSLDAIAMTAHGDEEKPEIGDYDPAWVDDRADGKMLSEIIVEAVSDTWLVYTRQRGLMQHYDTGGGFVDAEPIDPDDVLECGDADIIEDAEDGPSADLTDIERDWSLNDPSMRYEWMSATIRAEASHTWERSDYEQSGTGFASHNHRMQNNMMHDPNFRNQMYDEGARRRDLEAVSDALTGRKFVDASGRWYGVKATA